jgi:hypothetical protein
MFASIISTSCSALMICFVSSFYWVFLSSSTGVGKTISIGACSSSTTSSSAGYSSTTSSTTT